ncbi:MAG: iron(III) transport system permease protein [Cryomorphaceae bacterium]|jgi:iron(III) transport system permease protein
MNSRQLPWQLSSVAISSLILFPLLTLLWLSFSGTQELWAHLSSTVLSDYVLGSLQLMFGVAILTLLLGIGSAWLVTQYRFVGSGFFNWALLLPLAMPSYITAYSYTGLLDVAGPVQSTIRSTLGLSFNDYWFPEIRSMGGAIFVISFVLYPYVYMLARASFTDQSKSLSDAGQLLGLSRRQSFFRITLPIARPAVIAGLSLALMETLADYGTVSYFSVSTFTTGIFRTWYGLDSVQTAAQLSLMLLMFVIVLLTVEKSSRKKALYHDKSRGRAALPKQLAGSKQLVAVILASTPLLLGFIIPVSQLVFWAIQTHAQLFEASFWVLIRNTLMLASITALLALVLALILAYAHRIVGKPITRIALQIGQLGYAVPGTVIAVGTLIPLARLDNQIDAWFRVNFDISTGLLISGSIGALLIAYLVRFLAVSLNAIDSSLSSIAQSMDHTARSLGLSPLQILRRVHIPMLKTGLFTGLLVVFVDVMKELPATLILRPFNFNTLAVRAYELASDERLADASLASLAIVLVGLVPVILLSRGITSGQKPSNQI